MMGGPQEHLQANMPPPPPTDNSQTGQSMASQGSTDQIKAMMEKMDRQDNPHAAADQLNGREVDFQVRQHMKDNPGDNPDMVRQKLLNDASNVRGQHPNSSPGVKNKNQYNPEDYYALTGRRTI